MTARQEDVRARALDDLRRFEVVMEGHFDYGNGFHGKLYLNPHQLLRQPSTIWRVAQDLIDVMPASFIQAEVVAGPATGGALLAHILAGLLDGKRPLTYPPYSFAPFGIGADGQPMLSAFYADSIRGRRVLLADDVQNTGQTLRRCADRVSACGGIVVGALVIVDRMEAVTELGAPTVALVDYPAPANYPADACPLCRANVPITSF